MTSIIRFVSLVLIGFSVILASEAGPMYGNSIYNKMAMERQKNSIFTSLPAESNDFKNKANAESEAFGDTSKYPIGESSTNEQKMRSVIIGSSFSFLFRLRC